MIYVVAPHLEREIVRAFMFDPLPEGDQRDYSASRCAMEVPLGVATLDEDRRKRLTKAEPGDVLILSPVITGTVRNRLVEVDVCRALYDHGSPTFKRLYKHDDKVFAPVTWVCRVELDLKKLPYLYEAYIFDQHVR